ncbi:MAG: thermonuclease family protein [Acidimicrobiales bacterium]
MKSPLPRVRRLLGPATLWLVLAIVGAACGGGTTGLRGAVVVTTAAGPASAILPAGLDTVVEQVVDGDTVVVTGRRRIRLIGVDTPETSDPNRPVQCYGQEASNYLKKLLPPGTTVRLVGDVEQSDAYGRTLAYIYRLPDLLFVNRSILAGGYGRVLAIAPNYAHDGEMAAAASLARDQGRGLWSSCPR